MYARLPSKMGHTTAQQYVNPYFYDIRKFEKAKAKALTLDKSNL